MIRTAMIDSARAACQLALLSWLSMACQARAPATEVALPPGEERAAAGAPSVAPPATGGAPNPSGSAAPSSSVGAGGGNATTPAGSGASGTGGSSNTGSDGASGGGGTSGNDGASGRDGDSQSSDEQRYALLAVEPRAAGRTSARAPGE